MIFIVFLLSLLAVLHAAATPLPLVPAGGAVTYSPHPHFKWQREADVTLEDTHRLQIARDEAFVEVVCDDRLEVVSRFVPVEPLPPGKYWWRVRRGEGGWSQANTFKVNEPERVFTIRAGSGAATVACVIQDAAAHCPAKVNFEPGEYTLAPQGGKTVVNLAKVHDLIIDGHGAKLVLAGTFLNLKDCERVTIRDFNVTADIPGHTLVRITGKDTVAKTLTVRPEPGYDPDVTRFFGGQGFLNRLDPEHRGRHLGGFVSTETAHATPAPNVPGSFIIGPVTESALHQQEAGALCVLTLYGQPFVMSRRTQELIFSGITLVDMPGAFSGGSENNAKSYLSCRVLTRSPNDYQGGHSAVGDGRTGEWIEGCEFQMLADDGPNVRTMRMKIAKADGDHAAVLEPSWTNTEMCPGDTVAFTHPRTFATAKAIVVKVSKMGGPMRVEVDTPLAGLAAQTDINDWNGAFFYRVNPCCEDFVYRRNRHFGGRGHGVKFNGRRGWIADNHFENITGNAIEIGYNWKDAYEGYGASEVLIARNIMKLCGWAPITSFSKTPLGGHYIIRDNHIQEVRDSAISLRNCTGVNITGNTFASTNPPGKGAWIITDQARNIHTTANRHPGEVPEMKSTETR